MVRIKSVLNLMTYVIALLGFCPLFAYLEPAAKMFFPLALVAGLAADRRERYLPAAIPTVLSLLCFGYYALRFSRDNPVDPAANLIVILLAVRIFSEKNGRNYLQIFVLALFALAASSLYNLSAAFLLYLVPLLVLLTVSLVILSFHATDSKMTISRSGLRKVIAVSLVMPAVTIPLMLFFFMILPRTQYPLWNFLNQPAAKVAGFTETVQPGTAASVEGVKNVAFRAECPRQPAELLYWRGIVLNTVAGDRWIRKEPPAGERSSVAKGVVIRQTIYPEPGQGRYLLAMNIPRQISGIRVSTAPDQVYAKQAATRQRIRYEAISVQAGIISIARGIDREFYLQLPDGVSPRMRGAALELARKGGGDRQKLALLEDFYRRRQFYYSTTGLPVGPGSLDTFLFDKRLGHCELFATSAATLLRQAGIPARLVGGYLGGVYNELGGYYTVSEDMAHVWLEAYVAGEGWLTVDPSRWVVNSAAVGVKGESGAFAHLSMYLDALGYYWNRAVINYDLERQVKLLSAANRQLRQFGLPGGFKRIPFFLVVPLIIFAAIVVGRKRRIRTREEKLLDRFLVQAGKKYRCHIGADTGLFELAGKIDDPLVHRFVNLYGQAVYHDRPLTDQEVEVLKQILAAMKRR